MMMLKNHTASCLIKTAIWKRAIWPVIQVAVVLALIIGANMASAPKAQAFFFGGFCTSPQLCLAQPWYRLKCPKLCCLGPCLVSDAGTHAQLNNQTLEMNKNFMALNSITSLTAINAITLKLGIGSAGKSPFELPLIAAPIMNVDPMNVEYGSGCVQPLWILIKDERVPPPPPAYVKELNEDMPNPAFSEWIERAYYASLSGIVENPGRFLEYNSSQELTRQWCRNKFVGDVAQLQAANAFATLQMIKAYQTRMAEYMAAFVKANEPCMVEDLSFMQTALALGIGALFGNAPTEVAVMGCARLDLKIQAMMARDRLIIRDHMRTLEAMQGWVDNSVGIARHGGHIFPRIP